MIKATLVIAILYFLSSIGLANMHDQVIYGEDNRVEFFQIQRRALRQVADSTAAQIPNSKLVVNDDGKYNIKADTYQNLFGVCSSEAFYAEPSAAVCSAFLVGDDLVATAGHCISKETCRQNSFVFSYRMLSSNIAPTEVDPGEVYRCEEVLAWEHTDEQDYALVKLDHAVRNHSVLTLSQQPAKVGDSLIVVGHPSGLPTKLADGANVRSVNSAYFTSNLDTFAGNSGSPVFNADTLEVVGILVRGEADFVYDQAKQCNISNHCSDTGCRGEDATNISYITAALNN